MPLVNHISRAKAVLHIVDDTLAERGIESGFFTEEDENGKKELTVTGYNIAARILLSLEDVLIDG